MPQTQLYLLRDAARHVGVMPYQLSYAITCGFLPEPRRRLGNMRVFSDADLSRAKKFFENKRNPESQEGGANG